MTQETITLHWYMNETKEFNIIHKENGLALAVTNMEKGKWYEIVHLPTGLKLPCPLSVSFKSKKQTKEFFNKIVNAFNWNEWAKVDAKPIWANDAYKLLKGL